MAATAINSAPRRFLLGAQSLRLKRSAATGVLYSQEEGVKQGEGSPAQGLFIQRNLLSAGLLIRLISTSGPRGANLVGLLSVAIN